jgi:hypothetical protein
MNQDVMLEYIKELERELVYSKFGHEYSRFLYFYVKESPCASLQVAHDAALSSVKAAHKELFR